MTASSHHASPQRFFPQVSVVVPIYNGEADLPELLACLQAQTYPAQWVEYWLVDNGSRDRTAELIRQAIAQTAPTDLTLHYCCETQIQSSYAARNTGIKQAQGEILAFTDADCRPQPNWLQDLIQPFADPTIGIVAGEVAALEGDTWLEKYADRRETLSQKHTLAHPFSPYGQTANLAIRRQALQQVGLFRPYLTTGGDADLCWRILRQSAFTIHFAEPAIVKHRHRATLAELQKQWQRYGRSNRFLHDLHGISLMQELSFRNYVYRWSRWLLKEVPLLLWQTIGGKAHPHQLFDTALDLVCMRARICGQRDARLPEQARQIEWLSPNSLDTPTRPSSSLPC